MHTTHTNVHTRAQAHTQIHTHIRTHTCPHTRTCTHPHKHTPTKTHTQAHTHTHTHTCTRTHTHIDTFTFYFNLLKVLGFRIIMHNITETYPQIDDRLGLIKACKEAMVINIIYYIMLIHTLCVTVFMN